MSRVRVRVVQEGKQAVADVKDALYDVYHATFYSPAATQAVAFAILRDMLHHSEKAYKEIVESMEDLMYNPIKEEFLLAQLFERLANTDSVPLLVRRTRRTTHTARHVPHQKHART